MCTAARVNALYPSKPFAWKRIIYDGDDSSLARRNAEMILREEEEEAGNCEEEPRQKARKRSHQVVKSNVYTWPNVSK